MRPPSDPDRPEKFESFPGQWCGDVYLCDLCPGYGAAVYAPKPGDYTVQAFVFKDDRIEAAFVSNIMNRSVDEQYGAKERFIAQHLPDWLSVIAILHNFRDICSQEKPT